MHIVNIISCEQHCYTWPWFKVTGWPWKAKWTFTHFSGTIYGIVFEPLPYCSRLMCLYRGIWHVDLDLELRSQFKSYLWHIGLHVIRSSALHDHRRVVSPRPMDSKQWDLCWEACRWPSPWFKVMGLHTGFAILVLDFICEWGIFWT